MGWLWMIVGGLAAALGQPVATPESAAGPTGEKQAAAVSVPGAAPLRVGVLAFNIRYGTAPDGENAWPKRREQVFEILRDERLSVIGVQEALRGQLDDIHAACPKPGEVGVGRDDGKQAGEYSAILYRAEVWMPAKSGTFWLSETPEKPGSMSWKTAWDHISAAARLNGAKLIAKRIAERGDAEPFVLTGDFNSGEDEEAAKYFIAPPMQGVDKSSLGKLLDTFRVLHADEKEFNTFHAFDQTKKVGKKIDYVLVPPGTKVIEAWIDLRSKDGRAPSDHFPVGAIVEFPWHAQ